MREWSAMLSAPARPRAPAPPAPPSERNLGIRNSEGGSERRNRRLGPKSGPNAAAVAGIDRGPGGCSSPSLRTRLSVAQGAGKASAQRDGAAPTGGKLSNLGSVERWTESINVSEVRFSLCCLYQLSTNANLCKLNICINLAARCRILIPHEFREVEKEMPQLPGLTSSHAFATFAGPVPGGRARMPGSLSCKIVRSICAAGFAGYARFKVKLLLEELDRALGLKLQADGISGLGDVGGRAFLPVGIEGEGVESGQRRQRHRHGGRSG